MWHSFFLNAFARAKNGGAKMESCCPLNTKVIETRTKYDPGASKYFIYRRRECLKCGYRFTTREYLDRLKFKSRGKKIWNQTHVNFAEVSLILLIVAENMNVGMGLDAQI